MKESDFKEFFMEISYCSCDVCKERVRKSTIKYFGYIEPDLPKKAEPSPYFYAAKVEDEVISTRSYRGIITLIDNLCFPIRVFFDNGGVIYFNREGKENKYDKQTLFYLSDPNRPKIKIKRKVEIKRWVSITKDNTQDGYSVDYLGFLTPIKQQFNITIIQITIPFEIEEEI